MSNAYIVRFTLIMTAIVALVLAGMYSLLKDTHEANEAIFEKRSILQAVEPYLDKPVKEFSDQEVQDLFAEKFEQTVLDATGNAVEGLLAEEVDMAKEKKKTEEERKFPLYVYDSPKGTVYIISVRGNGLWDEIWGSIALKEDLNTIVGVAFDHKAETPGLGAEIKDNPDFLKMFQGKEIYDQNGDLVAVRVRKGGARDPKHEVDGISGATVTCDGVTEMLKRGIEYYEPYFKKVKKEDPVIGMIENR